MNRPRTHNILIIAADFYPKNSPRGFRATELVKELIRTGNEVSVLTNYHNSIEEHQVLNKAEYFYFKDSSNYIFNKDLHKLGKLGRKINEHFFEYPDITYVYRVYKELKSILKKQSFHKVISIASPHAIHWGVAKTISSHLTKDFTWIADCGDPFMGLKMNKIPKMPWFAKEEKMFCRLCDYITVPVSSAIPAYYPEFHEKIKVIPQGFNFKDTQQYLSNYIPNEVPTFLYAGALSPMRDIRPLLDYLTSLETTFKFIVHTQSTSYLKDYIFDSRISVRPYISREKLIAEMSRMDFLVNISNMVSEQVPSKLIDYYLMQRPVLNINQSDLDNENIDAFLKGAYDGQLRIYNPDQYKIQNVVKKFMELNA